eukprot:3450202-Lingulodinium_polyedra.AAC.1
MFCRPGLCVLDAAFAAARSAPRHGAFALSWDCRQELLALRPPGARRAVPLRPGRLAVGWRHRHAAGGPGGRGRALEAR